LTQLKATSIISTIQLSTDIATSNIDTHTVSDLELDIDIDTQTNTSLNPINNDMLIEKDLSIHQLDLITIPLSMNTLIDAKYKDTVTHQAIDSKYKDTVNTLQAIDLKYIDTINTPNTYIEPITIDSITQNDAHFLSDTKTYPVITSLEKKTHAICEPNSIDTSTQDVTESIIHQITSTIPQSYIDTYCYQICFNNQNMLSQYNLNLNTYIVLFLVSQIQNSLLDSQKHTYLQCYAFDTG
jgi:hypothetical protein